MHAFVRFVSLSHFDFIWFARSFRVCVCFFFCSAIVSFAWFRFLFDSLFAFVFFSLKFLPGIFFLLLLFCFFSCPPARFVFFFLLIVFFVSLFFFFFAWFSFLLDSFVGFRFVFRFIVRCFYKFLPFPPTELIERLFVDTLLGNFVPGTIILGRFTLRICLTKNCFCCVIFHHLFSSSSIPIFFLLLFHYTWFSFFYLSSFHFYYTLLSL